jgi:uncharacterized protein YciI
MEPTHFLYLLVPPRPTFVRDADPREREIMARHAAYLGAARDRGFLLMAGPTLDGAWGVGVLQTRNAAEAEAFRDADPAVTSGLMEGRLHPWSASITRLPGTPL